MQNLEERLSECSNEQVLWFMVSSYQLIFSQLRKQIGRTLEDGREWDDDDVWDMAICQRSLGNISAAYDAIEFEDHNEWLSAQKFSGETMWDDWNCLLEKAGFSSEQLRLELEKYE